MLKKHTEKTQKALIKSYAKIEGKSCEYCLGECRQVEECELMKMEQDEDSKDSRNPIKNDREHSLVYLDGIDERSLEDHYNLFDEELQARRNNSKIKLHLPDVSLEEKSSRCICC